MNRRGSRTTVIVRPTRQVLVDPGFRVREVDSSLRQNGDLAVVIGPTSVVLVEVHVHRVTHRVTQRVTFAL